MIILTDNVYPQNNCDQAPSGDQWGTNLVLIYDNYSCLEDMHNVSHNAKGKDPQYVEFLIKTAEYEKSTYHVTGIRN